MPLINIVIALIIVGVALWLINRFYPHGLQHLDDSASWYWPFAFGYCRWRDYGAVSSYRFSR